MLTIFSVNEHLELRLENKNTLIYIDNELFRQCKKLIFDLPKKYLSAFEDISSIDDAVEKMEKYYERSSRKQDQITPEIEFWGHCSNFQAWAENYYDTRLLHSNLAFPLLKKLAEVGDQKARNIFKKEIIKRIEEGSASVIAFLYREDYLNFLDNDEFNQIFENPKFIRSLISILEGNNSYLLDDVRYLLEKIGKESPTFFKRMFDEIDFTLLIMNFTKIMESGLRLPLKNYLNSRQFSILKLNLNKLLLYNIYTSIEDDFPNSFFQTKLLVRVLSRLLRGYEPSNKRDGENLDSYALPRFLKTYKLLDKLNKEELENILKDPDSITIEFFPILFEIPEEGIYTQHVEHGFDNPFRFYTFHDDLIEFISTSSPVIKKVVKDYLSEEIRDYHNLGKLIFLILGYLKERHDKEKTNLFVIELLSLVINRLIEDLNDLNQLPKDNKDHGLTSLDYRWLFEIPQYLKDNICSKKDLNQYFGDFKQYPKEFFWNLKNERNLEKIKKQIHYFHTILNKIL